MATGLKNVHEDLQFYNELKNYIFESLTKEVDDNNQWLVQHGIIQIETMLELAISKVSGLLRESTVGRDFHDGSDAKKVTSCFRQNNIMKGEWTNSYIVAGIKNKRGVLRIMGFNRARNSFDYYAIPYEAYSHLKADRLDIPLDHYFGYHTEAPVPAGGSVYCKWNRYRVNTFTEMATRNY